MKKVIFLFVAIFFIALSSCNKTKECSCVTHYSGSNSSYTDDVTVTFTIDEGDCEDSNTIATTSGLTATTNCYEI